MSVENKKLFEEMRKLLLDSSRWRMLDEVCPRCGTILFLDKQVNLKYCPKCKVYLASPEELQKAKIDLSKMKIYDFEEYWKMVEKGKEIPKTIEKEKRLAEISEKEVKQVEKVTKKEIIKTNITDALDSLILTLIDKLTSILLKSELSLDECIEILFKLIKLRKELQL